MAFNERLQPGVFLIKKKRFKLLFFILGPVLVLLISNFFIMEFYVYKTSDLFSIRAQETFNTAENPLNYDIDYLILGDSTALYSLSPNEISPVSMSKALIASSIFLSEKLINKLELSKVKKGILISQSFIKDHYDLDVWSILVPNHLMSLDDTLELLTSDHDGFIQIFTIALKYIMSSFHLDHHSVTALMLRLKTPQKNLNDYRNHFKRQLKINNGHYGVSSTRIIGKTQFLLPFYNHFNRAINPPVGEIIALRKIIKTASQYGIPVYFIKIPQAGKLMNLNTDDYDKSVNEILNRVGDEKLKVIDGKLFEPEMNREDFVDFNHANELGAKKISNFIKQQLASSKLNGL